MSSSAWIKFQRNTNNRFRAEPILEDIQNSFRFIDNQNTKKWKTKQILSSENASCQFYKTGNTESEVVLPGSRLSTDGFEFGSESTFGLVKNLSEVARNLSIALNSVDVAFTEKADLPDRSVEETVSDSSVSETSHGDRFAMTLSPRSPAMCIDELMERKKNKAKARFTDSHNFSTRVEDLIYLNSSTGKSKSQKDDRLKAHLKANVPRTTATRMLVKDRNADRNRSNVVMSNESRKLSTDVALDATRSSVTNLRRDTLTAARQSAIFIKEDYDTASEESRVAVAKRLRTIYLIFKFTNSLLDDAQQRFSHPSTQELRQRLFAHTHNTRTPVCPLLQATFQSFFCCVFPTWTAGDNLLSLDHVLSTASQLPLHLATLKFTGRSAVPKTKSKTGKYKKGNLIQTTAPPTFNKRGFMKLNHSGRSSYPVDENWGTTEVDPDRLCTCVIDRGFDSATRLVMVKAKLRPMIERLTANILGDYDFETIKKYKLVEILSNMVRDLCRDVLRINHNCEEAQCRRDTKTMPAASIKWEKTADTAFYTVVANVHLFEKRAESIMVASQCLQEHAEDSFLSCVYEQVNLRAIVVVYFMRKYVYFRNDFGKSMITPTQSMLYKYWLEDKVAWINRQAPQSVD